MIYAYRGLPAAWVVAIAGVYWIVPAIHNGWTRRTRFNGHVSALELVPEHNKTGLGIPQ